MVPHGLIPVLSADGETHGAAGQLEQLASEIGFKHLQFRPRIAQIVADDERPQGGVVVGGVAGPRRENRAEGVEEQAVSLPRRHGGGIASRPAETSQSQLEVVGDHIPHMYVRVVHAPRVGKIPREIIGEVALGPDGEPQGFVLVGVVLRGLANAVGTALEIDLFAEDVAGVVGWHQGRVQHRETGGGDPIDVVDGVAELRPQQRVVSQLPIDAAVGLPAILLRDRGDLGAEVEAAEGVVVRQLLEQPAVGGTTRIGDDAPQGRHIETAGIAEAAGGGAPPIHLVQAQHVALEIAGGQQQGAVVAQPGAEHPIHIDILLGAVVGAGPVLRLKLGAFIAAPGDEVDHAGDGVGTINGGGAIFQDLDPLDGEGGRQGGDIDEAGALVSGHR